MKITPEQLNSAYKAIEKISSNSNNEQQASFSDLLKQAGENVINDLQTAESISIKAATGDADLQEVIMAVSNAEITLNSVVSIRDRVIQAYQDILRMPI